MSKKPTEEEVFASELEWERKRALILRKFRLKKDKRAVYGSFFPKLPTTKLLMVFLFLNCTAIEIFTGYITLRQFELVMTMGTSLDLTPLVALVSAVVGEVVAFAVYAVKSAKENTAGGLVFEKAMRENHPDLDIDAHG